MSNTLTLTQVVIVGLATARFTALLVLDSLFERVRHNIFKLSPPYDDIENGYAYQQMNRKGSYLRKTRNAGFVGRLLSCYYCTGVWVATVAYAALVIYPSVALPVLSIAALAQVSDIIIKVSR